MAELQVLSNRERGADSLGAERKGGSGGACWQLPPDMSKIGVGPFDETPPNRHVG